MHSLINKGMDSHFCSTVSEYMRFLVRRDQMPPGRRTDTFIMPKTANEVIEDALRDGDDALESLGIYRV